MNNSAPGSGTLYVDLDGTLIYSDLLIESCLALLQRNALYVFALPFWLLRGRAYLKRQVAERVSLRVDLLPYNRELIDYLTTERQTGRQLVLISAADQKLVDEVADFLGIFDEALGSAPPVNLAGARKLDIIRQRESEKGGNRPFGYAANHRLDLAVWREADPVIAVNASPRLLRALHAGGRLDRSFPRERRVARELLRALRPHQWLKNLLLFLPLLLASQFFSGELLWRMILGVVSFSLCSSSVYLLNDLLDLTADRQHPTKRFRPFAAGTLSPLAGIWASPALLFLAFGLALVALPVYFTAVLAVYYLTTLLYSFVLKKVMLVDVITLATLYTLRVIAGAAAIPVIPSFWLLAFSMFFFLSLGIIKRHTELAWLQEAGVERSEGRGYLAQDLQMMAIFGSTSGFMAVMVFALYINSVQVQRQYTTPEVLWFICPLLLYLLSRIWLLAHRGDVHEDPVVFVLRDRTSQMVVLTGAILLYLAHLDWRTGVSRFILSTSAP